MEHICSDPWNGFHFGSVGGGQFEIENFALGVRRYTLKCDETGTRLWIGGEAALETNAVGRFTHFEHGERYSRVIVPPQKSEVSLTFGTKEPVRTLINGEEAAPARTLVLPGGKEAKIELYW
jgi:hypothetical protein